MKTKFCIIILPLLLTIASFGQNLPDSLGFTNKAEAKNLTVKGLKEGKWVEWKISGDMGTPPDTDLYYLTIYKRGLPYGIKRGYYKTGEIESITPFNKNGLISGIQKTFYRDGEPEYIFPFTNGKEDGVEKDYDRLCRLYREVYWSNGSVLKTRIYDGAGNFKDCPFYTK